MEPTTDVVVIGGGVVGTSSAYWLARSGLSTLVLERRSRLGTLTTPNSLGTIRTQFGTPALIELAQESARFFQTVESELGVTPASIGYANRGYLYLTERQADVDGLRQSLELYRSLGVTSSELLDRSGIAERFTFAGGSVAGIFHGDGAWVDPATVTTMWASAAAAQAAANNATVQISTDTEVLSMQPADNNTWQVKTTAATISAGAVVVCAGPYAPGMLAGYGVELPHKITPRFRAFIPDVDPARLAAPLVINIVNGSYWRPVPGGVWLSHANVDDSSVDPAESITVPDGFALAAAAQIEPVSPGLAERVRQTNPDEISVAGGFQVYPADDVPFIDEAPGSPGLFYNCGHWAGVMLSPAAGRLLADLVTGRLSGHDNPCRLSRFDEAGGAVSAASTNKFGGWG